MRGLSRKWKDKRKSRRGPEMDNFRSTTHGGASSSEWSSSDASLASLDKEPLVTHIKTRNTHASSVQTAATSEFSPESSGHSDSPDLASVQQDMTAMKEEFASFKREVMNEMHVMKYDLMKEMTMLKGSIAQLADALHTSTSSSPSPERLSRDQVATISKKPSRLTNGTSRSPGGEIRNGVRDSTAPTAVRASSRVSQLAPVDDKALSTPLAQSNIDKMFPLIDFSTDIPRIAAQLLDGTRMWALQRVQSWLDSAFNVGSDMMLACVGDSGTGKTTFMAVCCEQFPSNILASHFCKFDRKVRSVPRHFLLSVVHQVVDKMPAYKNQLARLNLRYVLQEKDAYVLASKVLLEPLNAVDEPITPMMMVIDGLDQCDSNGRNELLEFLSAISPELPNWLGILFSSKPEPNLAQKLPISSMLDFSPINKKFVEDTSPFINDMLSVFHPDDQEEAKTLLQEKAGGNFSYLEFTKLALSQPSMGNGGSHFPLDALDDLPESLYAIYNEIFEDKFGKGHSRIWRKVQPLLQLIVAAASGPYSLVRETKAQEHLSLSKDEAKSIRRALADIVSVKDDVYRIERSAVFDWLTAPERQHEKFYFNVDEALRAYKVYAKKDTSQRRGQDKGSPSGSSTDGSVISKDSSGYRTPDNSFDRKSRPTRSTAEPVSILKRRN